MNSASPGSIGLRLMCGMSSGPGQPARSSAFSNPTPDSASAGVGDVRLEGLSSLARLRRNRLALPPSVRKGSSMAVGGFPRYVSSCSNKRTSSARHAGLFGGTPSAKGPQQKDAGAVSFLSRDWPVNNSFTLPAR
jgi:hypothetical protein